MIEAGTIEAGVEANADDLIALDDVVIAVDPATLETVDFVDPAIFESGIADSGMADLGSTEAVPLDDAVADDSGIVFITSESLAEEQPTDGLGAESEPARPVDPMPNWRTLDGGTATDDVAVDDGSMIETGGDTKGDPVDETGTIDITMITDKDGSIDDTGSIDPGAEGEPSRPVDPMPEWRTVDGVVTDDVLADDGSLIVTDSSTDGSFEWTYEDFVKSDGEDGTPPLYTMDPDDPRIFQTLGPVDETPGRGSDPLPYERTNADPVLAAPVEIDRTPVNYAAADTFSTGLDLL